MSFTIVCSNNIIYSSIYTNKNIIGTENDYKL